MDSKIRFSSREAQAALGIGNTRFWNLVKSGRVKLYYDGGKGFVSRAELERYDAECQQITTNPQTGKPRAVEGLKGVQVKEPAA